jgi:hypothetical protein
MKQDEIIEMAKQAGYKHPDAVGRCEDFAYFDLEAFAKLVAAKEREACAKLMQSMRPDLGQDNPYTDAIRARGEA